MLTYLHANKENNENKYAIGNWNHVKDQLGKEPQGIAKNFKILSKCQNKFVCLIFEMFFIRDLKPKLNKQSDSICEKLFV